MKLLTKELREKFPKLYENEDKDPKDVKVIAKFFDPCSQWTWYATEGEPDINEQGEEVDYIFFGFVRGLENELGNFSLSELQSYRGRLGLGIERDLYFGDHTLAEVMERHI